jgi:YaiO family outer membrane protein
MRRAALLSAAIVVLAAATSSGALAEPSDSFELGTGSDHLTGTYEPWSDTYALATQHGSGGRPSFYEQYDEANRYGLHDFSYAVGAYGNVASHTVLGLELSSSPTHEVAPSFAGSLSVEQRFADGYGATVAMTRRTYSTTNASIETVGADRYVGRYRFSYTASLAQLEETPGTALTQSAGVTFYDDRGGDIGVRAYAGRDVENTGSSVLVMRVNGASLVGHLRIAPATFLVYGAETFNQGGRFSGTGGKLGVSRRF